MSSFDYDPAIYDNCEPSRPTSELAEVLIGRWETDQQITADKFARDAVVFAIHELLTDRELAEELGRMQAGGAAA